VSYVKKTNKKLKANLFKIAHKCRKSQNINLLAANYRVTSAFDTPTRYS